MRYADEQGRTWGTPGAPAKIPSLRDGVAQKAWFCGTPGQVIDGIKSIEAKYPGLEDYMIHWAEGLSPGEFEEQLRWFARDVMPAFSGVASRSTTAQSSRWTRSMRSWRSCASIDRVAIGRASRRRRPIGSSVSSQKP